MNTGAKVALILAGGTGGHIFPAWAVAKGLQQRGWQVHWLGAPNSMEARLIGPSEMTLHLVQFKGVRGKGLLAWLVLPLRLARALWQSWCILRSVRPHVVLGFGGYISLPAGIVARWRGIALMVHEQNSVAGSANRILAKVAQRSFTAFPKVLPRGIWVGNPLRHNFLQQSPVAQRYGERSGNLRVLVLGGSLGAQVFNQIVPQALALLPAAQRPVVQHQGGAQHMADLQAAYAQAQVEASLHGFIDDPATAMASADVLIGRAGASTVCEVAAVGVASYLVPYPYATDDHQTGNARFLADADAALWVPQAQFTAAGLAQWLQNVTRAQLCVMAAKAQTLARIDATRILVQACEECV